MAEPRLIIKAIQRERGFDPANTDPSFRATPDRNGLDLGRALKRLSDQLYSSDGHFLLELLQNADDNEYAPGAEPTVTLELGATQLVLWNNEIGFSEQNVQALCSVGDSTKANKAETTGEKGIGFKAVFKVSDRPEIHSGGFHFCFDRVLYGDLGLVTPRWLDQPIAMVPSVGTTIVLPFKESMNPAALLTEQLCPELLLFLRRLRRLVVVDTVSGESVELARSDEGAIVTVQHERTSNGTKTLTSHRFYRHTRAVSVSDLREETRKDVASTTVVVAAVLKDDGTVDGASKRKLFAFLPVRESGLRFLVNADFVLTTSRDDVMRERPWNIRLRDELGLAAAEAVLAMQKEAGGGRTALRLISRPDDVADSFIKPILERAIGALKGLPCVPVSGGQWAVPDKAIRHDSSSLSELIPPKDAAQVIGKSLIDDEVGLIADGLELLRVQRFTLSDLLKACAQAEWIKKRSSEWFADLYRRLEPLTRNDETARQLRLAPIIRISDGSLVAATKPSLFRSLSRRTVYGFEDQLAIVDPSVLKEARDRSWLDAVDSFLKRLNVRDADAASVIETHILPTHSLPPGSCQVSTLLAHGRYLCEHLDDYLNSKGESKQSALDGLRAKLWILTTARHEGSWIVGHATDLYLGDAYGGPNRLQFLLHGVIESKLVDPEYLADDSKRTTKEWVDLFVRLGASTFPRVQSSSKVPSHFQVSVLPRANSVTTAEDWVASEEFAKLIALRDPARKLGLVALLDRSWAAHWSQFENCRVKRGYHARDCPSSLLKDLQGMYVPDSRNEWVPLAGLYQPTEDNEAVFGSDVRYLRERLTSTALMEALGVVQEPTVEQVLNRLRELSGSTSVDKKAVGKLYRFLEEHWEHHKDEIANCFRDYSVVCITQGDTTTWARSGDCCWDVPARLRKAAPLRGLVGMWPRLEEFFCENLQVRTTLSPEEWVSTLLNLDDPELDVADVGDLARQVYRELEALLAAEGSPASEEVPGWFEPVKKETGIWTTRGEWWNNDGDVFADDEPALAALFKDSPTVGFIDIPPSELPRFARLLRVLGIPYVSGADREALGTGGGSEVEDVSAHLRSRWPFIVRILYHRDLGLYERTKADGRLRALKDLSVFAWSPLLLEVSLNNVQRQSRFDCKLKLVDAGVELLVDHDEQSNWPAIGLEIGRYLGLDESTSSLIGMVLGARNAELEKTLRTYRLHQLPDNELEALAESPREVSTEDAADSEVVVELEEAEQDEVIEEAPELPSPPDTENAVIDDKDEIALGANGVVEPVSGGGDATLRPTGSKGVSAGGMAEEQPQKGQDRAVDGAGHDHEAAPEVPVQDESSSPSRVPGPPAGTFNGHKSNGSAPPTRPDSPVTGERKPQRSPGRLISYVTPLDATDKESEGDEEGQAVRDRTNLAAIDYVVLKEKEEHRTPDVKEHANPGYDIESFNASGELDRYIEVKGLKDAWGERGVEMSSTQFAFAREHRDRSWLYVVEYADEPARRKLWRIRDPAAKVMKFGFDHGWQGVADLAPPPALAGVALVVGARWRCDDGVIGTVETVKRSPSFVSVVVVRSDGTTVSRTGPEGVLLRSIVGD